MRPWRWRKMTWLLLLWSVLFLIWMGAAGAGGNEEVDKCVAEGALSREACETAVGAGTGIGIALIFILWLLGFLVLSVVWLMSRPRHRQCPRCGEDVKKGRTACGNCGYDFARATDQPAAV